MRICKNDNDADDADAEGKEKKGKGSKWTNVYNTHIHTIYECPHKHKQVSRLITIIKMRRRET